MEEVYIRTPALKLRMLTLDLRTKIMAHLNRNFVNFFTVERVTTMKLGALVEENIA